MRALSLLRLSLLLTLGVLIAACDKTKVVDTTTQVTVRLHSTDRALLEMLGELRVSASLRQGMGWRDPVTNTFKAQALDWPVDIPVFPRDLADADKQFEVIAEAVQDDVVIAQARAVTSFVRGKHLILELDLFLCPGMPGHVCAPDCHGNDCTVCTERGMCERVSQIDPDDLKPSDGEDDAGMDAGSEPDAGDEPSDPPDASDASTRTDAMGTGDTGAEMPSDASADAASLECDDSRPCTQGYLCSQGSCVSVCTQTQCDPNATCSLNAGVPTCTCGSGFITMQGGSGGVTCTRDLSCEQLNCDTNATCVMGTNQVRSCQCKPGYTGSGTSCAPVSCGQPTLNFGVASVSGGSPTYGATVTYTCNPGYTRTGAANASCGVDAKWSASAMCNPVDCGNPGTPTRGSYSTNGGTKYGNIATYSCTGGTLQGTPTRECQANGTWSGTLPTCLYCGDGLITTPGEECDPMHSSWNAWNCSNTCIRTTSYVACPATTCLGGQVCFGGFCTQSCSTTSSCPAVPTGRTAARCPIETNPTAYGICVAAGCATSADCAPGLGCYTGGNLPYCADCSQTSGCL